MMAVIVTGLMLVNAEKSLFVTHVGCALVAFVYYKLGRDDGKKVGGREVFNKLKKH